MSHRKQQGVALLKAIETGAAEPLAIINPDKYIQHNLAGADGLAGLSALLATLPDGSANPARVFENHDHVFALTDYNFFGPMIGFDIFRFENGRVVEHWDNLQATARPNPGGHSMLDGPTEPRDLDKTYANKQLVRAFVDSLFSGSSAVAVQFICPRARPPTLRVCVAFSEFHPPETSQ